MLKKQAEPAFTSTEVRHASKSCSRGRCYAIFHTLKKRAEPAFTSAEVRHASKSCSRGRCYAISHTLKKRAEFAFTSAEVRHASKSCSRGRCYAISHTLKGTSGLFPAHSPSIKRAELPIEKWGVLLFFARSLILFQMFRFILPKRRFRTPCDRIRPLQSASPDESVLPECKIPPFHSI